MGKYKKYTPEFKIQCVKEVLEGKKSQKETAAENDMTDKNIRIWVKNYQEHGEEYFYQELYQYHLSNSKIYHQLATDLS